MNRLEVARLRSPRSTVACCVVLFITLAVSIAGCSPDEREPSRNYDALAYALTASFDWDARQLTASEDITLALAPGTSGLVELDSSVTVGSVRAGSMELAWTATARTLTVDLTPVVSGTTPVVFTVEYTASGATSLVTTTSSAQDPVRSRVVFTDSEPNRGHEWLVQKDDPADRALFSVTLTVAEGEDVIANGERISDTVSSGTREVAYALDVPIPTYLMAFAAGELDHVDRPTGSSVPLSVWYRHGLAIDSGRILDEMAATMASLEALLGPYPFSRYSMVFQPVGAFGMENATITIESEDFALDAFAGYIHDHELAHHWFGDQVTMHGYDDVWVKEGMATLLAAEVSRARSDREGRGRLMASLFPFREEDAIVDTRLTGLDKYTTGPYERAAALITQIRAKVGETAFWAHLRVFLGTYAWSSATGEQFVRVFSPDLGEAEIQQVLGVLPRTGVPRFGAQLLSGEGFTQVDLVAEDPTHVLLAPYELTVVNGAGAATRRVLTPGVSLHLEVPADGYLAPDEDDAFPDTSSAVALFFELSSLMEPAPGSAAGEAFASRSAAHQERALRYGGIPALTPAELQGFYDSLDSDSATTFLLAVTCANVALLGPAERAAWLAVLIPIFHAPRVAQPTLGFMACGPEVGASFLDELTALAASAGADELARLEYLLWFEYDAAGEAVIADLVATAPTLRLRHQAMMRAGTQLGVVDTAGPAGLTAPRPWRACSGGCCSAERSCPPR